MKKFYFFFLVAILFVSPSLKAQVVINEVYGGGGNSGATYKNDFIELYNNGISPVSLTGWSVQYASSAGTTWQVTNLSGSIPAHGYYLIQESQGAGGTVDLPTPDATGTIPMSATAGKVALANSTTALSGGCPTGGSIIDFVGYGGANCFEGSGPTTAPSNTTSVQRTTTGQDTNNNAADFSSGSPSPTNSASGIDTTPPVIVSTSPSDNSTGVNTNSSLSIVFSESITKSVGVITVHNSTANSDDYVFLQTSNPNVTVAGATLTINGVNLQPNNDYYINIPDSIIKDLAGNKFAGIADNSTWNFSTGSLATPVAGQLNFTYNLNTSSNIFSSDGFKQFSVRGPLVWEATTFGNTGNALQMNGFFSNTNQANEDWLILPPFDLSATTFPLLSFSSRTKFNGDPLQLRVSTNYPGYGNPNNFTWTDVNGKFPAETSDTWTGSSNINLSAFKQSNVYIAFVYTSSNDDGARWTLDDIRVDNSSTPPPATITTNLNEIQFGFVANGSTSAKTFTLTGSEITNDINIVTSSPFAVSKDGVTFSSSITYTVAEANNIPKTVYVQFAPMQNDHNYIGPVQITSGGLIDTVNVKGSSLDPVKTLEVVNWNLEWFGSTVFGPTDDNQQEQNVGTIMRNIGADLFALAEVVDTARLGNIVRSMPGYAYVVSNYGSHTNPNEVPAPAPDALAQAQKLAFVYNTSIFSNISTTALLSVGINSPADVNTTSYNNWASGRFPFMMTADVTLDGVTKTVRFVLIHAKANTAPTTPSYNRRKAGADDLHTLLNSTYGSDNVMLLGDFNDDLDQTITDGITPPTTSYISFTSDTPSNYLLLTLPLSLAGERSTVTHDNVIDHVVVSNELGNNFISGSSDILSDVSALVTGYGTTTSDHYPVFTRYTFSAQSLPIKLNYFTGQKNNESVDLSWSSGFESNSKEYRIERSSDGRTFSEIGNVQARGVPSKYSFTDQSPLAGNNFYRLKLVDLDGKFDYSKSIRINFTDELIVSVKPNPASGFTYVSISTPVPFISVSVYDAQGRVVKGMNLRSTNGQQFRLDVSRIPNGVYILKLTGAGISGSQKLIIRQ
jgi:hypothetical protein